MRNYKDKSTWGEGPWTSEPDRLEFETACGLTGLVLRGPLGALCGYVGVPPGHPLYKVHYNQCTKKNCRARKRTPKQILNHARMQRERAKSRQDREIAEMTIKSARLLARFQHGDYCSHWEFKPEGMVDVHGGLTYSNECQGSICHTPREGEAEHLWWFGFDTAHHMDLVPSMAAFEKDHEHNLGPRILRGEYRDLAYVRAEVEQLAAQLAAIGRR